MLTVHFNILSLHARPHKVKDELDTNYSGLRTFTYVRSIGQLEGIVNKCIRAISLVLLRYHIFRKDLIFAYWVASTVGICGVRCKISRKGVRFGRRVI
jgi:hypothetical protein